MDTAYLSEAPPFGAYLHYIYMTPQLARIHFNKWEEILLDPVIDERHTYAALLQHFAKGMAYAHTGKMDPAKQSLDAVDRLITAEVLTIPIAPFSAPKAGATVARNLLAGAIEEAEGKYTTAIEFYRAAVKEEDAMVYNEPEDWLLASRPYLGNVLLKNKQHAEAKKVFEEDLKDHPNNLKSLKGLRLAGR
jgi:tetratricopeptide (TPR) repeat protein